MDDYPRWRDHPWTGLAAILGLIAFVVLCGLAGADDMRHEIARAAGALP